MGRKLYEGFKKYAGNHKLSAMMVTEIDKTNADLLALKEKMQSGELSGKDVNKYREVKIKELREKQKQFILKELQKARELEEKGRIEYQKALIKDNDVVKYNRIVNKINSMDKQELSDFIIKNIGENKEPIDYDSFYAIKSNLNILDNSTIDFFNKLTKERKLDNFHLYHDESGKQAKEITDFYNASSDMSRTDYIPILEPETSKINFIPLNDVVESGIEIKE